MLLATWVDQQGSRAEAAGILELEKRVLDSYLTGERQPPSEVAAKIVLNTGGKVDFNGIYLAKAVRNAEPARRHILERVKC